jgi:hypothetical protein
LPQEEIYHEREATTDEVATRLLDAIADGIGRRKQRDRYVIKHLLGAVTGEAARPFEKWPQASIERVLAVL